MQESHNSHVKNRQNPEMEFSLICLSPESSEANWFVSSACLSVQVWDTKSSQSATHMEGTRHIFYLGKSAKGLAALVLIKLTPSVLEWQQRHNLQNRPLTFFSMLVFSDCFSLFCIWLGSESWSENPSPPTWNINKCYFQKVCCISHQSLKRRKEIPGDRQLH